MQKKADLILLILLITLLSAGPIIAVNTIDTRFMHQPALSDTHIAFIYANDLWVTETDGSNPRRLTSDAGIESSPFFSPDGSLIAFSAEYDGNTDVYTIPVEGGIPRRLTWHPGTDYVRGFTPEGRAVLFASQREDFSNRYLQLFTIPLSGGFPTRLVIPNAHQAVYSPNGKKMAYTPISPSFQQWKNYRGGTVSNIWIFDFERLETEIVPQDKERSNDWCPMWIDDAIWFLSDRNGEFNLFSFNPETKVVTQHTRYNDFPINSASSNGEDIIFEQAGKIFLFSITDQNARALQIGIAAELTELRPRYVNGVMNIRSAHISPTGSRAVFGFRGDVITVPAEKGDPRNITETTGVHEKYPAWSPDGRYIAYFSDASGEYELHINHRDGKGGNRIIPVDGTGFYAFPEWSPNSKYITFCDNGRSLHLMEVETGNISKIDADELYIPGAFRQLFSHWSPDSRWIAYTKVTSTHFKQIFIYSVEQGRSFPVTDGLSDAACPVFDPEGKFLIFLASTDAGPVINWFDQSSHDMHMTSSVYLATLRTDIPSPFARESDEEKEKPEDKGEKDQRASAATDQKQPPISREDSTKNISIEFEGIENRIVSVPLKAGNYSQLGMIKAGEFYYVSAPFDYSGPSRLFKFDMKERKESEVMELDSYILSADGKKMLYRKGQTWGISDAGKKPEAGKGVLNISAIEVKIDPVAEWEQIFEEAWRINRDYFYDPGMHGADWAAMKKNTASFCPTYPAGTT